MGSSAHIVAAGRVINGNGSLSTCNEVESALRLQGVTPRQLIIDPLLTDWHSPLEADHFRSGCAPIEALAQAKHLIESGQELAVVISGTDQLISDYTAAQRNQLMAIYGPDYPLTLAYNDLALHFSGLWQLSEADFRDLATKLFDNYLRTHQQRWSDHRNTSYKKAADEMAVTGLFEAPDDKWYSPLTTMFRGVDCANPVIDFDGRLVVCASQLIEAGQIQPSVNLQISGVGLGLLPEDGKAAIPQIAGYQHLHEAFTLACQQAHVDFNHTFLQQQALLDVYTCYPVVPLGFLLASGLISHIDQAAAFIEDYPLTLMGGMNLARAPWNNPALNSLIAMAETLPTSGKQLGLVHGNGGLGYRQGVAILSV